MSLSTTLNSQPSTLKLIIPSVWLEDVAKMYPKAYLHGFDISSAQYPKPRQSIPLSVHDALRPFPKEHHSRYDLVHIRLLTAGLKKEHYSTVLANARALLSTAPLPPIPSPQLTVQNPVAIFNGKKSTTQPSAQTLPPKPRLFPEFANPLSPPCCG